MYFFSIISLICHEKNLKCCVKQSSVSFCLASPTVTAASGVLLKKRIFPGDLVDISKVRWEQ